MTRTYSVMPVPTTPGVRVSARLRASSHRATRIAEVNQYDTAVKRRSRRSESWALPVPNHTIWVP